MALSEDYLKYLQENVNALERAGDKLHGADERLDWVVKQLQGLMLLEVPIKELNSLLNEMRRSGFVMPGHTDQIRFQETLPITSQRTVEEPIPLTGTITSVTLHFPACAAPANPTPIEIAVGHGSRQFIPYGGFIALDSATPVFPCSEKCVRNEKVWCIMRNTDTVNPHTCSAIVTICGD